MAVQSPPLYLANVGSLHPAEDDRRAHHAIFGMRGGIVQSGDLAVTQNGTPNMTVNVATGQVVVPGSEGTYQGAYLCENRGSLSVSIAAADATNPRYDLIVARVRDQSYSGATNTFAIEAVTGTPAASPAEPTIPANSWVLARITVAALDTAINTADITDRRTTGTGQFGQAAALGGTIICTSTTRPTAPFEAMKIYETDTDIEYTYSGSAWVVTSRLLAAASFTPTITQGVAVSKTVTYSRFTQVGRWVTGACNFSITSSGTASSLISVTTPVTAAASGNLPVGYGVHSNGSFNVPVQVVLASTTLFQFFFYSPVNGYYGTAQSAVPVVGGATTGTTSQLVSPNTFLFNFAFEAAS